MEIRDPVHGSIPISNEYVPILEHPFFRRLKNIKQLGMSEYVFPGATHTRYLHSLGVMDIARKVADKLFENHNQNKEIKRLVETLKLACLLHDVGHAPLSHSTENVMPKVKELDLPERFKKNAKLEKQASHEDYTIKSIADSSFTDVFKWANSAYGVNPDSIAELIVGQSSDLPYFEINNVNYFPILHQLVSSELDCDRMDYLLRDSYFCGVSYGHFDLDWIIDNLQCCIEDKTATLGITERAISTFDDFLLSRYHMFLMVYFHYKSVCLEKLLTRFFNTSSEYSIPPDIEKYQGHDDHYLMKILRKSENKYAKSIVENKIPPKIFESFQIDDLERIGRIEHYLKSENIEYIKCSSKGRLSKYYKEGEGPNSYSLRVVKAFPTSSNKKFLLIDEATDLFKKYSDAHSVNRIHCWMQHLNPKQKHDLEQVIGQKS